MLRIRWYTPPFPWTPLTITHVIDYEQREWKGYENFPSDGEPQDNEHVGRTELIRHFAYSARHLQTTAREEKLSHLCLGLRHDWEEPPPIWRKRGRRGERTDRRAGSLPRVARSYFDGKKRENQGHEKRNVPSFNRTFTIHGTGGPSNGGGLKVTYEETWKLATATVTRECLGGRSRKKLRAPQKPEIRIHTVMDLILSGNQSWTPVRRKLRKKTFLIVT